MDPTSITHIPAALVPHLRRGLRFRLCQVDGAVPGPSTHATAPAGGDPPLPALEDTTREIHDRVKNNLQTIASLLRLQSRRLAAAEAKEALAQSVRRIQVMALLHETLAGDDANTVPFAETLRALVRLVQDGQAGGELCPVRFQVEGDLGNLPPHLATPLLSALGELLDNAARHAFPPHRPGETVESVIVHMTRQGTELVIDVWDNGVGLPDGFSMDGPDGLGLTIAQTLITDHLGGTLSLQSDGGTWAHLQVPLGTT